MLGADGATFARQHYQLYGWKEGRNPNAVFDAKGYLNAYQDVAKANVDPLLHYDLYGYKEGRDPSTSFDTAAYLAANPGVASAGANPMVHYLMFGAVEGRQAFNDARIDPFATA